MPAPRHSKPMVFRKLDSEHALAAKASLALAMPHLADAVTSLEFGVPCEKCEELRTLLDFVGCALTLTRESIERLGKTEWPA